MLPRCGKYSKNLHSQSILLPQEFFVRQNFVYDAQASKIKI